MMTTRRTTYVTKPSFQLKLTIIFMLMVTIVANLVGGMCYWLISDKFYTLLEQSPDQFTELSTKDIAQFLVPNIFLAQVVSLCFVFALSILVTHTIAGPVYRMERIARDIGKGNLKTFTRLRPRDELKELADAFNDMTAGLVKKVRAIRDEIDSLEGSEAGVDLTKLRVLVDEFQLPETDVFENVAADPVDDDELDEDTQIEDLDDEDIIENVDDIEDGIENEYESVGEDKTEADKSAETGEVTSAPGESEQKQATKKAPGKKESKTGAAGGEKKGGSKSRAGSTKSKPEKKKGGRGRKKTAAGGKSKSSAKK